MKDLFSKAGFFPEVQNVSHWKNLPLKRKRLAKPFKDIPPDELLIRGFDVVLAKEELNVPNLKAI